MYLKAPSRGSIVGQYGIIKGKYWLHLVTVGHNWSQLVTMGHICSKAFDLLTGKVKLSLLVMTVLLGFDIDWQMNS